MSRTALIAMSLVCVACAVGVAMVARDIAQSAGASPFVTTLAMSAAAGVSLGVLGALWLKARRDQSGS